MVVLRLSISEKLFSDLDSAGALGMQAPECARGDVRRPILFDVLREKLQLTPFHLKVGLHCMQ